ncbi:MAG: acyl-CoA thioesterase [Verrucomicrobia bacterium]|nr:MAG: acyl-CoA thioesterase [Verrucomicrobiota bacterium]
MLEHRSQIEVRYAETDMMGVVYHGSYLPWLEVARTAMLAAEGVPYRDLETQGFFLPVVEIAMRYLRPARYPDIVTVHARLAQRPTARLRIDYELWRAEEKIAVGHTTHVFIDRSGRPVRPPRAFTAMIEQRFGPA